MFKKGEGRKRRTHEKEQKSQHERIPSEQSQSKLFKTTTNDSVSLE